MDPQALQNWFIAREKRDALNPFQRILAVIDSEGEGGEGEIIAYAKWELPTSLVVGDGAPQEELDFGPIPPLPEGANREVCRAFRSGVDGMREKWGDKKEVFGMSFVPIVRSPPNFQPHPESVFEFRPTIYPHIQLAPFGLRTNGTQSFIP